MALPAPVPHFTAENYLAWDPAQLEKHEYVAGEVFAMSGYTRTGEGQWLFQDIAPEMPLPIPALEIGIPRARIFRNLD